MPRGVPYRRRFPRERLDQVSQLLVAMVPYHMIKKQLSEKWGVKRNVITYYIKAVHDEWAEASALTADTRRHQIRAAMEAMYMKVSAAGENQDLRTAAQILRELSFLDGCNAQVSAGAAQTNVSVNVGLSLASLGFSSPDDVRGRVEELRGRIKAQGAAALASPEYSHTVAEAVLEAAPRPTLVDPARLEDDEK